MADNKPNGPIPIDEGDLLAFIEGDALPAPRAAAIQKTLERDPALARRVEAMRGDRLALSRFGDERCPDGLIDSVLAAVEPTLERRMLLGMERDSVSDRLPISVVRPARPSVFGTMFAGRASRLAAAAGLVLTAAVGAYFLVPALAPSPHTAPTIADRGTDPAGPVAIGPIDPVPAESLPAPTTVAGAEEGPDITSEITAETPAPAVTLVAEAPQDEAATIDDADLLRLAAERRLVIIVRAQDLADASDHLDRIASRSPSAPWRVSPQVPDPVLAALTRQHEPPPVVRRRNLALRPDPMIASRRADRPAMMGFLESPAPAPPVFEPGPGERLYLLESRLDESTLAAIRSALASAGAAIDFRILDEPLPGDGEVMHPDAVLWWDRPPAAWTRWASIPVLLEHQD